MRIGFLAWAVLFAAGIAAGGPVSPGTADDPNYGDKKLWPDLDGREYFLKQTWPRTRILVWAHAGEGEVRGRRGPAFDQNDGKNWVEYANSADAMAQKNGKPAAAGPDTDADVILPDSESPYSVIARNAADRGFKCRNLTIGKNAAIGSAGAQIAGNLWIKDGGVVRNHGSLNFTGSGHVFVRDDTPRPDVPNGQRPEFISQYITFNRAGGSGEFRGRMGTLDEFRVMAGTMIIGPDSWMQPGRNATPMVAKGATLALMDGAHFGKWLNQFGTETDMILGGTIQGGLPDRPLTRDAYFGLSFKNWCNVDFGHKLTGVTDPLRDLVHRCVSMTVEGGALRSYTKDPAKAMLVVKWHGLRDFNIEDRGIDEAIKNDPAVAKKFESIASKINVFFAAGSTVDGVRFEDVAPGCLLYADADAPRTWKNVSFGKNVTDKPDTIYKQTGEIGRNGVFTRTGAASRP